MAYIQAYIRQAMLYVSNNVTAIGTAAFSRCTRLKSINMPNSVTTLGNCAFEGCSSLSTVTISNSVTIERGSFYGGSSKTFSAFTKCKSISRITITGVDSPFGIEKESCISCLQRLYLDKYADVASLDCVLDNIHMCIFYLH